MVSSASTPNWGTNIEILWGTDSVLVRQWFYGPATFLATSLGQSILRCCDPRQARTELGWVGENLPRLPQTTLRNDENPQFFIDFQ